jgi:beta-glucosidase
MTAVSTVRKHRPTLLLCLSVAALASCQTAPVAPPPLAEAPAPAAPVDPKAALEARVQSIVSGMTLEQKIGQMTQPDIRSVKPDEVRQYYIGSILNGGGAWPAMNMHSSVDDWLKLSDEFYKASMSTDMAIRVPVVWGTDAVHGHNNVYGATLFPQNIGLGAAHDPQLMERIGHATAEQVRATGITWAFAPTLAVVQNPRWGRTYESYSSDPALVRSYGEAMTRGLQGTLGSPTSVLATAKHYLGDGGTFHGVDQGETRTTEADLMSTHAAGYYGALAANVQTVMVSYSSFTDTATGRQWGKMHANAHLVGEVLKRKLGFDGIVVSDWNGIEQVPGCAKWHCPQAINAGLDLIMVPDDWKQFIPATVDDVKAGRIPMSRIDDAVSRIIRVKLRSGLFDNSPVTGPHPDASVMSSPEVRELAREAVRKSLVLLKNDRAALPLKRTGKILVVGKGADSVPMQSGGWSLTWQGDNTKTSDYPNAQTLVAAMRKSLGEDRVDYSVDGTGVNVRKYSGVVMVAAEQPYAEMKGDITFPATIRHSARYPGDLKALQRVSGKGVPVVTVLYSGRPVAVNDLINRSDAFVAAFLPGTEGQGIIDLLLAGADGAPAYDFTGRLSFDWPAGDCLPQQGGFQFDRGYGLSLAAPQRVGRLPDPAPTMACPAESR